MARRLFFLFDGSSNRVVSQKGVVPTNIYYLNQAISNGVEVPQISFYFSGVGTWGDESSAITGRGFDDIIMEAYTNLSSNYMDGDEIYLFGFSRGAAAARTLSAIISREGLLRDARLSAKFPIVWELYVRQKELMELQREKHALEKSIAEDLWSPKPTVRFLGAFDTVPGWSFDLAKLFMRLRVSDLAMESCVETAVQILAIDDDRTFLFDPLLWKSKKKHQNLEQIWMPGVHGDIGGHSDATFIGNIALLTMIERLQDYCRIEYDWDFIGEIERQTFDEEHLIQITDERSGLVYPSVPRGIRKTEPCCNGTKHELVEHLENKIIKIRNISRPYRASHVTLPIFRSKYSDRIRRITDKLPTD